MPQMSSPSGAQLGLARALGGDTPLHCRLSGLNIRAAPAIYLRRERRQHTRMLTAGAGRPWPGREGGHG